MTSKFPVVPMTETKTMYVVVITVSADITRVVEARFVFNLTRWLFV